MTVTFRGIDVPVASRYEYWRDTVTEVLGPLDIRIDGSIGARDRLTVDRVGPASVGVLAAGEPAVISRTTKHVSRMDSELASAHHVSLRYLHKLFQTQQVTVGGWIRQRRLELARRDLSDPLLLARPVGAIAARWGFASAAHFSRAFRQTYGVPPGEYRMWIVHHGGSHSSASD